jgi:trehalose/maltose hydrolase-like predicted phosphorylase
MPLSPPPITDYRPEYLPAYLSNGLIGLRVGRIPPTDGLCIVNGLVERDPVEDGEGFARGPYPLAGDIEVDGHQLSAHHELARFAEQRYDFSCGELLTRFEFQPGRARVRASVLCFCSRTLPTLVLQELTVEVDEACDLTLTGALDHTGLSGAWRSRRTQTPGTDRQVVDGLMEWETRGGLSVCGAAYVTTFDGADGARRSVEDVDLLAPLRTRYRFRAEPGRRYVMRKIASLISSRLHTEPDRQAARMAFLGATRGFDRLRRENREAWADIWRGRIRLVGADERWQGIVDACFYYLHASAHASSLFSTSMFGLAYWPNYSFYRGHVMWDIEAFALPVFVFTAPDVAHSLLDYRLEHLTAARRNAAMNGYAGLQFPWASSPVHGEEVIRLSKPQVIFEQHVSPVIARAFAQFCHATGSDRFLRENAWPVLSGVARWLESRVVETARGFEIRETLGIAESEAPVDNNAYVNMAAAVALREAAWAAMRLDEPGAGRWEAIAERLVVPIDPESGVVLNHDGYVSRDGDPGTATPEALAGLFPIGYPLDPDVERATLRFYLDRIEPYLGWPMLSAPLGVWAARLGDRALSARLFEAGCAEFVDEPFRVVNEFSPRVPGQARAGPLIANVGGLLTGCLLGLTRLTPGPGVPATWCEAPAVMPDLWDAVEVDRIWVRGRPARLVSRHGERATIAWG